MNTIIELKLNLICGLLTLTNRYPDCLWLAQCFEMNQNTNPGTQFELSPEEATFKTVVFLN
jgi:hypothetical protein